MGFGGTGQQCGTRSLWWWEFVLPAAGWKMLPTHSQGLVSAYLSANFAREKGMSNRTWISPSGLQYGDAGDASTPVMLILDVSCADLIFRLFTEILEQPPVRVLFGEEQAGFRLECGVPRRDYRVWWPVASSPFQGQIPNFRPGE